MGFNSGFKGLNRRRWTQICSLHCSACGSCLCSSGGWRHTRQDAGKIKRCQ